MQARVRSIPVPQESRLHEECSDSYFHDCYLVEADTTGLSALDLYLATVRKTPKWIDLSMQLRNAVVGLFGIKNLGRLSAIDPLKPASSYSIGERIGIFTLLAISDQEVLLGDADRHLDVKVSVLKLSAKTQSVAVTTVVHVHNTLGRVYMAFVRPAHKLIAPAVLSRALLIRHPNS